MQHTIILCPIYNDEYAFNIFAAITEEVVRNIPDQQFSFLIVNDGTEMLSLKSPLPITIVHLHRNLGHQKAIAIGIAYAEQELSFNQLIIMDCDGEDRPEDIIPLLNKAKQSDKVVVANRVSRQESNSFQFFYRIYKWAFYWLIGKRISFGNFMLLPKAKVNSLAYFSETWHHLAAAVIKSQISYTSIETHRGKRYTGNSKMNFTALLLHGLGAIGVFVEIIASRLLVLSLILIAISVASILVILLLKLFTTKAIPGWTTTAFSSMLIVLLQSFLLSLFTIFLYLSSQGQRRFIPALHYMDYVRSIENSHNG